MTFDELPKNHYRAILADPPWQFDNLWGGRPNKTAAGYPSRWVDNHYDTMHADDISSLPVGEIAADDCVLFIWTCWPILEKVFPVIEAWGFKYKTCAFNWTKAHAGQIEMFQDDIEAFMGLGYWTRANTEPCLLATRGKPKRLNADVRQAIIAPKRQHSRKPEGVHGRIERLVAGPYLELFARQRRPGWDAWGNETDKFTEAAE